MKRGTHFIPSYPPAPKPLPEKCPYLELFLTVFSCIRTEYGEIRSISPYWVRMRKNADQNNSEYGHFYAVNTLIFCSLHLGDYLLFFIETHYHTLTHYNSIYGSGIRLNVNFPLTVDFNVRSYYKSFPQTSSGFSLYQLS